MYIPCKQVNNGSDYRLTVKTLVFRTSNVGSIPSNPTNQHARFVP